MNTHKREIWLRLYIIEKSPNTPDTLSNLKFCLNELRNGYKLEVIDILTSPEMIIRDNIMASPTLIKVQPPPSKRIVGTIPYNSLIREFDL
jgi:circadian clock protein KaiB